MKIWLVTIGEPVPLQEGEKDRLHRTGYFASFLADHGHEVTWWTSTFDHFRKKQLFEADTTVDINPRLRIVLLRGSGYRKNLSLARMRDHATIARRFVSRAEHQPDRPDIIVAALPTIELCLASVRYGKDRSIPVVLDMRDMWPDIFVDSLPSPLRPPARLLVAPLFRSAKEACSGATAIIGITEEFVEWGLQRGCRSRSSLDRSFAMGYTTVPPSETDITRASQYWDALGIPANPSRLTACFIGSLGRRGALEPVVDAARRLEKDGADVQLVICGTGDRDKEFSATTKDVRNVLFPGWIDAASIYVLMRRSHVGLDPLPDRYDFLSTINNKAIEYMSAGLPVISSPDRGTLFELLRTKACGLSYATGDAEGLAGMLARLSTDRSQLATLSGNASALFRERFTAEAVYTTMMEYLEELVTQNKRANANTLNHERIGQV